MKPPRRRQKSRWPSPPPLDGWIWPFAVSALTHLHRSSFLLAPVLEFKYLGLSFQMLKLQKINKEFVRGRKKEVKGGSSVFSAKFRWINPKNSFFSESCNGNTCPLYLAPKTGCFKRLRFDMSLCRFMTPSFLTREIKCHVELVHPTTKYSLRCSKLILFCYISLSLSISWPPRRRRQSWNGFWQVNLIHFQDQYIMRKMWFTFSWSSFLVRTFHRYADACLNTA